MLIASEFLAVVITALGAKIAYLDWYLDLHGSVYPYAAIGLAVGLAMNVALKCMGLYDIDRLLAPELGLGKICGGIAISFLIVLGGMYAIKETEGISRAWFFAWLLGATFFVILTRMQLTRQIRRSRSAGHLGLRIGIIGTRDLTLDLANRIRESEGESCSLDLFSSEAPPADLRVLGGPQELAKKLSTAGYDKVVIAVPPGQTDMMRTISRTLGSYSTELLYCSEVGMPMIATRSQKWGVRVDLVNAVPTSENSWLIKRTIDVVFSAVALLGTLPLLLIIALSIKIETRGPVLFIQRRVGQNNKLFSIYKFRSMTVAEDGETVVQATRNDQRVTRVGRFLRATSLDELPQLLNVLFGQMSLVGPRPHALAHDQAFEQQFDLFSRRRRVKPGLTGWAQINGYRGETRTPEDVRKRMEHDLYYIDNWSIWLDLEILVRTLFVFARNAY